MTTRAICHQPCDQSYSPRTSKSKESIYDEFCELHTRMLRMVEGIARQTQHPYYTRLETLQTCQKLKQRAKTLLNDYSKLSTLFDKIFGDKKRTEIEHRYVKIQELLSKAHNTCPTPPPNQDDLQRAQTYGYEGNDPIEAQSHLKSLFQGISILIQGNYLQMDDADEQAKPDSEICVSDDYLPSQNLTSPEVDCKKVLNNLKSSLNSNTNEAMILRKKLEALLKYFLKNFQDKNDLVKALIELGVLYNIDNEILKDLYLFVFKEKDKTTLSHMLKRGANPNIFINSQKDTPLHLAVSKICTSCFTQILLNYGADVHLQNLDGNTPLHEAATHENITLLLDSGADLHASNNKGNTPVHEAVKRGFRENVDLLLARGANPNLKNHEGNTPLHEAVNQQFFYIIQSLLNQQKTKPNLKNHEGNTPLHIIAIKGDVFFEKQSISSLLLDYGANLNARNIKGNTPLHEAIKQGKIDEARFLVKRGADLNVRNNDHDTPLGLAHASYYMEAQVILTNVSRNPSNTRPGFRKIP